MIKKLKIKRINVLFMAIIFILIAFFAMSDKAYASASVSSAGVFYNSGECPLNSMIFGAGFSSGMEGSEWYNCGYLYLDGQQATQSLSYPYTASTLPYTCPNSYFYHGKIPDGFGTGGPIKLYCAALNLNGSQVTWSGTNDSNWPMPGGGTTAQIWCPFSNQLAVGEAGGPGGLLCTGTYNYTPPVPPTPTPPSCSCSGWTNGSCGAGGCGSNQRQQTRTCTPSGCDVQSQCVTDSSCTASTRPSVSIWTTDAYGNRTSSINTGQQAMIYWQWQNANYGYVHGLYLQSGNPTWTNVSPGATGTSVISTAGTYQYTIYAYDNYGYSASSSTTLTVGSSTPTGFSWYQPSIGCSGTNNYITLSWSPSSGARGYNIWKDGGYLTTVYGTRYTDYPGTIAPAGYDIYAWSGDWINGPFTRVSTGNLLIRGYYSWPNCNPTPPSSNFKFNVTSSCSNGKQVNNFTWNASSKTAYTVPPNLPYQLIDRGPNHGCSTASLSCLWTDTTNYYTTGCGGSSCPYIDYDLIAGNWYTGDANKYEWASCSGSSYCVSVGAGVYGTLAHQILKVPKISCVQPPTATLSVDKTVVASGETVKLTWSSTSANSCSITSNPATSPATNLSGTSGSNVSTGAISKNTQFNLTCTGSGGTASDSKTVTIGGSLYKGLFVGDKININLNRDSSLHFDYDANVVNNPPPGFSDILNSSLIDSYQDVAP